MDGCLQSVQMPAYAFDPVVKIGFQQRVMMGQQRSVNALEMRHLPFLDLPYQVDPSSIADESGVGNGIAGTGKIIPKLCLLCLRLQDQTLLQRPWSVF